MRVGSSFDPSNCPVLTTSSGRWSSRHLLNLFALIGKLFADPMYFGCTSKSQPFGDFYLARTKEMHLILVIFFELFSIKNGSELFLATIQLFSMKNIQL